jgi:hypothetical protein
LLAAKPATPKTPSGGARVLSTHQLKAARFLRAMWCARPTPSGSACLWCQPQAPQTRCLRATGALAPLAPAQPRAPPPPRARVNASQAAPWREHRAPGRRLSAHGGASSHSHRGGGGGGGGGNLTHGPHDRLTDSATVAYARPLTTTDDGDDGDDVHRERAATPAALAARARQYDALEDSVADGREEEKESQARAG